MDNNITPTTFVAYEWNDLLSVFPDDFADHAYETLETSGKVTFGDAEHTLIKGTRAERILYDAWDDWDGAEEHSRREVFARLPSLINALVALNG
jgi:hypothetical protein